MELGEYSSANVVQGNYIGTDSTGALAGPAPQTNGVLITDGASNNTVGGTAIGAGNVISDNSSDGVLIDATASGNQVLGNTIGTNAAGGVALPNAADGVAIAGSNNTVGGAATGAGNLISGNTEDGVIIFATGAGNQLLGNMIGTNAAGNDLGNGNDGVHLEGSNNTLGVTLTTTGQAGSGNIIAFNQHDGVEVSSGTADAIRQDSIYANANLGIALDGGNNNQAAPTLATATFNAGTLTIHGTLTSTANTTFHLALFASAVPVAPLVAQGAVFLNGVVVSTNGAGTATFTDTIMSGLLPAAFSSATTPVITATATDPTGDTSQFSASVTDPVLSRPAFTSAKAAAFTVNTPGSFTVTTSGFPAPTLSESGALPKGLTFNRTTGVLSGAPAAGSSGSYVLHFTARNGVGAAASQSVTLTVNKLVTQLAIPSQVSVAAPAKVAPLGHDRFEASFTLTESASSSLAGRLAIVGFTNLPAGATLDSSTSAAFPGKSKKITLAVVFTNTTATPLATLLAGLSPLVDETIA